MRASLVVSTLNSLALLEETLPLNLASGWREILIVDSMSDDGTQDYVKAVSDKSPNVVKYLRVPKEGLGRARNTGTLLSSSEFLVHAGPDNFVPISAVEAMIEALRENDLVTCTVALNNPTSYLDRCMTLRRRRISAGPTEVVGTPFLAKRAFLEAHLFSNDATHSDDTQLSQDLKSKGFRLYRVETPCEEFGRRGLRQIASRWLGYGKSDAEYYYAMRRRWTLRRKIRSMAHPFVAEVISTKQNINFLQWTFALPFFIFIAAFRYAGWFLFSIARAQVRERSDKEKESSGL